jgi:hypothetical protein
MQFAVVPSGLLSRNAVCSLVLVVSLAQQPINYYMQNYSYCPSCGWPKNQTWQHNFSIHYLGQYPVAELQCWHNNYKGSGTRRSLTCTRRFLAPVSGETRLPR